MRILWLSHFLPHPPTGHGALQRSHNLLREAARRHEVHLVAMATAASHADHAPRSEAISALESIVESVHTAAPTPDPFRIRRGLHVASAVTGSWSYWERWLWSPVLQQRFREVLSRGIDVIHVDAIFLVRYLQGLGDVRFVLNHHNIESDLLYKRADLRGSQMRRAFFRNEARKVARLEKYWSPRAQTNLVVSELDGDRLRSLVGDVPTAVVANGVDVEYFSASDSARPQPKHMAFAGGMDWFPNREAMEYLARELWPALRSDDPARRMTVIGRNPPTALLEAAQRDESLRVLGFVDDVRPHLCSAPIYLCPIRIGGGTRLKILDALAMSRALVSTGLGVEGLDLVDGVHYLRAETSDEFVAQIRRLEQDASLRSRLASAGRALVEQNYSWSVIGDALDRAFISSEVVARASS